MLHRYQCPKSVQGSEVKKGQVKQKIIEAIQGKAQIDISLCYCVTIISSPNNFCVVQYCISLRIMLQDCLWHIAVSWYISSIKENWG